MFQSQSELLNTSAYLSWKRLQLSRAKLKASSKTSALLSGFAMVAMVELQYEKPPLPELFAEQNMTTSENFSARSPPDLVVVVFAVCTTLLVAVHMVALMISTCILPNIEAVCNLNDINLVHESPHERLHWYIEIAWIFSTLIGLLLFLFEIVILCWVKFYGTEYAIYASCVIIFPVVIVFIAFAIHFYKILAIHKCEVTASDLEQLEVLKQRMQSTDFGGGKRTTILEIT